jgi:hypothetical protein
MIDKGLIAEVAALRISLIINHTWVGNNTVVPDCGWRVG